jgi:hypothetical protein
MSDLNSRLCTYKARKAAWSANELRLKFCTFYGDM